MTDWFPEGDGIFQQDGAPAHTAKSVKAFLAQEGIEVLDWPGNSPDLNPIENLWAIMKSRMASQTFTNRQQLLEAIIRSWFHDIGQGDMLTNLIKSMPNRLAKVISAKGGHSGY